MPPKSYNSISSIFKEIYKAHPMFNKIIKNTLPPKFRYWKSLYKNHCKFPKDKSFDIVYKGITYEFDIDFVLKKTQEEDYNKKLSKVLNG